MQYALLFQQTPEEFADRRDPEKAAAFWAAFMPYMTALKQAGLVVAGAGLEPPATATSIRIGGNGRQVHVRGAVDAHHLAEILAAAERT